MTAENKAKVWKFIIALVIIVIAAYYLVPIVKDKLASKPAPVANEPPAVIDVPALKENPTPDKLADAIGDLAKNQKEQGNQIAVAMTGMTKVIGQNTDVMSRMVAYMEAKSAPTAPPVTPFLPIVPPPASNEAKKVEVDGVIRTVNVGGNTLVVSPEMTIRQQGYVRTHWETSLTVMRENVCQALIASALRTETNLGKRGELKQQEGSSILRQNAALDRRNDCKVGFSPEWLEDVENRPSTYYRSMNLRNPQDIMDEEAEAAQAAAVPASPQVQNTQVVVVPSGSEYVMDGIEWIRMAPTVFQRPCLVDFTTPDGRKVRWIWTVEWTMMSVDGGRIRDCKQLNDGRVVGLEKSPDGKIVGYFGVNPCDIVK